MIALLDGSLSGEGRSQSCGGKRRGLVSEDLGLSSGSAPKTQHDLKVNNVFLQAIVYSLQKENNTSLLELLGGLIKLNSSSQLARGWHEVST